MMFFIPPAILAIEDEDDRSLKLKSLSVLLSSYVSRNLYSHQ